MEVNFKKYWRKTSLKKTEDGIFLLKHIINKKPKNFLEIGVFHGVTSRNVCETLHFLHGENFNFIGIDLFLSNKEILASEHAPNTNFSNPLKKIYYKYILRSDPYSLNSVKKLLKKFEKNINILKGDSNIILKEIDLNKIDYVFLDGGHKYETVREDLRNLVKIIENNGTILCDDYNLTYAPGVRKAIDEYIIKYNYSLKIFNSRFAEITK